MLHRSAGDDEIEIALRNAPTLKVCADCAVTMSDLLGDGEDLKRIPQAMNSFEIFSPTPGSAGSVHELANHYHRDRDLCRFHALQLLTHKRVAVETRDHNV